MKTAVKQRDFFSYCTSLRPIELKAIGALSQVRHFREGDRIYAQGDIGDEYFIINRGAVELLEETSRHGVPATVLSRGDIFGIIAPLLNRPRDHSAQARATLSVQCMRRKDFPHLLEKVPSFFLFLTEKMANRLYQANELARSHHADLELTGSLANFDIVTIYQTILHSKQTGLLTIGNGHGENRAEFFFEKGAPRWGRFDHLAGEEAFWQLFLHDDPAATFSFANGGTRREPPASESVLVRQADDLLINAIHMRDEFDDVRKRLPDRSATIRRKRSDFTWDNPELAELQPAAEAIWDLAGDRPISLGHLCRQVGFCDLKIYKAADEMVRSEMCLAALRRQQHQLAAL